MFHVQCIGRCHVEDVSQLARSYEDLDLRFSMVQRAGFFIGHHHQLYSPTVRTLSELASFHRAMEPFRKCTKQTGTGRGSLIWQYGLIELEDLWNRCQLAVKKVWESTGGCRQLQRMQKLYDSNAAVRSRHLEYWEREHMAAHDKIQHRPTSKFRSCDKLLGVRRLLLRWQDSLKKQEQLEKKARQSLLKKRAMQERQVIRLRREAIRRKMRNSDLNG